MGHCTLITAHTFIIPIQLNLVVVSSTHLLAWPCGYLCCYAEHRLCHAPTDTVYYSASTRRRSFPKTPTERTPLLKIFTPETSPFSLAAFQTAKCTFSSRPSGTLG